jgi:hypothetical protein
LIEGDIYSCKKCDHSFQYFLGGRGMGGQIIVGSLEAGIYPSM